ncbi:N-6 DNA methylase [Limosilactobacillus mucosae]|uniref:N-6 DNA methylase n=1 Tax=Limosilactobacillus mucosae TaxID=97478 RepID=A0AAJ1HPW2_LIMMU|nr:N-6 DNA methylase [Limosilactobacillus mucosae]MDC2828488.1 N-6 DNA methylase [Limosilactobacillus mucosae]MDC2834386.1 N-6 DNA methylase [Limosilactobacillus mucosae]
MSLTKSFYSVKNTSHETSAFDTAKSNDSISVATTSTNDLPSSNSVYREDRTKAASAPSVPQFKDNVSRTHYEPQEGVNFYLPADAGIDYFPQSKAEKVSANLQAIRTLKKLGNAPATRGDQVILSKYVGWGGLANDFFDTATPSFAKEREELQSLVTEKQYNAMRASSLTAYYTDPGICRAMWDKVISDGLTSGNILDPSMGTGMFFMTMPEALRKTTKLYGVELDDISGRIAQKLFPKAHIWIKGFQDVDFTVKDNSRGAEFDLVISNIPFGSTKIYDAETDTANAIHDYFVLKSLKLLRDYGELAIISSAYLLDKKVKSSLPEICSHAEFLGGVRLPSSSFKKLAGTTVVSDVLFFEKDVKKTIDYGFNQEILAPVQEHEFPAANGNGKLSLSINDFFWKNNGTMSSRVLGSIRVRRFHGTSIDVQYDADNQAMLDDLGYKLKSDVIVKGAEFLTSNWGKQVKVEQEKLSVIGEGASLTLTETTPDTDNNNSAEHGLYNTMHEMPVFEFSMLNGDVYYKDVKAILKNSSLNAIDLWYDNKGEFKSYGDAPKSTIEAYKQKKAADEIIGVVIAEKPSQVGKHKGLRKHTAFFAMPYKKSELARIKGMITIKEAYRKLIKLQTGRNATDADSLNRAIKNLNIVYDRFQSAYGSLNSSVNTRLFRDDNSAILVQSLEDQEIDQNGETSFVKGMAFDKPMIAQSTVKRKAGSAHDALLLSLSENRGVDFEFMSAVYGGKSKESIIAELGDEIVIDPEYYLETGELRYVDRDTFLSGDVLTKIDLVKEIVDQLSN